MEKEGKEPNVFLIILIMIGVFLVGIFALINVFDPPQVYEVDLANQSEILVGEGETCITPYSEFTCQEDLECVLVSEDPHKNGVCMKK